MTQALAFDQVRVGDSLEVISEVSELRLGKVYTVRDKTVDGLLYFQELNYGYYPHRFKRFHRGPRCGVTRLYEKWGEPKENG